MKFRQESLRSSTKGNVRIRLGRADDGYGIVVYDSDGKFGATLTDAPLGAAMQLSKDGGSIKMLAMKQVVELPSGIRMASLVQ